MLVQKYMIASRETLQPKTLTLFDRPIDAEASIAEPEREVVMSVWVKTPKW